MERAENKVVREIIHNDYDLQTVVTKLLVRHKDGFSSEISLIDRPDKYIICFSTMIGCPVGCSFCISGQVDAFKRVLTYDEMIDSITFALNRMEENHSKPIVFSAMGEGEPSLNIENVFKVFEQLYGALPHDGLKFALGTAAPRNKQFGELMRELSVWNETHTIPIKLQYSLHSVLDRPKMFPKGTTRFPSHVLREIVTWNPKYPVELNITLIESMNDTYEDFKSIVMLLDDIPSPFDNGFWYVKLNHFNPTSSDSKLRCAPRYAYIHLAEMLRDSGHKVEYYKTDGSPINAACGQLHYQVMREEARNAAGI